MLREHEALALFEKHVDRLIWDAKRASSDEMEKLFKRVRGAFRKRIRALADRKQDFLSANGRGAFAEFQEGFRFAETIPAGTEVRCVQLEKDVAFFWKPETMKVLQEEVVPWMHEELEKAKRVVAVYDVHES